MIRLTTASVLACFITLAGCDLAVSDENEPVHFPDKSYVEFPDMVYFRGSVVGDGRDGPVNNQLMVWCIKSRMQCDTMIQFELRHNALGSPIWETIPIREWNSNEIVADTEGKDPTQLFWYQIRIDRKTHDIAYIRVPNPQGKASQGMADSRTKHWRIDDGKAYRNENEKH